MVPSRTGVARPAPSAQVAAILTWVYAVGFGVPTIPIAVMAWRERRLPWFFDAFPMFGGPWSDSMPWSVFGWLLIAYFAVTVAVAFAGLLLWRGRRAGAILTFALIPIEAIFWWGFALPFPPLIAVVRVALAAVAWRRLRR